MARSIRLTGATILLALVLAVLAGCEGLRYVQTLPEAKDFHPARVAVLPVEIGINKDAEDVADRIVTESVIRSKFFREVRTVSDVRKDMEANETLKKAVQDYVTKLMTVHFSDPDLSAKIGETVSVDAFVITEVDFWEYTTLAGDSVARIGMGMTMVEAATGKIMWRGGHQVVETYKYFKPELVDVGKRVVRKLMDEMPH